MTVHECITMITYQLMHDMTVHEYITAMITYQLMHDMTVHDCITINAWQWRNGIKFEIMYICIHDNKYLSWMHDND